MSLHTCNLSKIQKWRTKSIAFVLLWSVKSHGAGCKQCCFPPNRLAISFCRHWGGRDRSKAFCGVSASPPNLAVIGTHRPEGPRGAPPAQELFSSHKT